MEFSKQSRVWVYQSNRVLSEEEAATIKIELNSFIQNWLAHGNALKGKIDLLYNTFIVITVDESQHQATGCSIDSSVRMLKGLEAKYNLDLFNRFNIAFKKDNEIVIVSKEDFETLLESGLVTSQTIVFNNMVQNLEDFENIWEVPMENSWHNHVFAAYIQ